MRLSYWALRATARMRRATYPSPPSVPRGKGERTPFTRPRQTASCVSTRHPMDPIFVPESPFAEKGYLGGHGKARTPYLSESTKTEQGSQAMLRDSRFLTWARNAYLHAKHGEYELPDAFYQHELPSYAEARKILSVDGWPRHPAVDVATPQAHSDDAKMKHLWDVHAGWRRVHASKNFEPSWSLEQYLEFYGCGVQGTSTLNMFCEQRGMYEVLTREYVADLARHIRASATLYAAGNERVKVLEVGAGDGMLTKYLAKELPSSDFEITATDSGLWNKSSSSSSSSSSVAKMTYREAIRKLRPSIVICSWMPKGDDWSHEFRKCESLHEYIVIGERGCCGDPWWTFGDNAEGSPKEPEDDFWAAIDLFDFMHRVKQHQMREKPKLLPRDGRPLHERDGFVMKELVGASKWQLSRYDRSFCPPLSKTISFTKASSAARRTHHKKRKSKKKRARARAVATKQ